jgi:hypothetical protein
MATETKTEISREVVFNRVPPGDKWQPVTSPGTILPSLTEALEYHFQKTGETEFFLSARNGTIEVMKVKEVEVEKPVQKYSLYGEY